MRQDRRADYERTQDGGGLFAGVAPAEGIKNEFNPAGDSRFLEDSTNIIPYGIFLYVAAPATISRISVFSPPRPAEVPTFQLDSNPAGHSPQAPISLAVIVPDPGLSLIVTVDPLICRYFFFLKSPKSPRHRFPGRADHLRNLFVGKCEVELDDAIAGRLLCAPVQNKRPSFSFAECDRPMVRISAKAD